MHKKAFVVTGLGFGDEGKGTATHWLSHRYKAHTVIRTGGPQALHHVVADSGQSHVFSQFGSGTLRGAATHLSKHMLIDPHAILKEGEVLKYESGIGSVFDTMTIHQEALVITPFQAIAGRVRELLRGKNRRGSVGIGVGETVLDAEVLGAGAIRAKDLASSGLRKKLEAIQRYKWEEFETICERSGTISSDVAARVRIELAEMNDPDTVQWAIERFVELAGRVKVVDTAFVAKRILGPAGTVVFEGSQGMLLDRWHGFHPYTTKVRTTPKMAKDILRECGYDGSVQSLGILRAYHTRHGGGPFVSESAELTARLPDSMNKEHPWQGSFRVGYFDAVAARYAIEASGKNAIDGLVITCLDRLAALGDDIRYVEAYAVAGKGLSPAEQAICEQLKSGKDAAGNPVHRYSGLRVNPNPTDLAYQEAMTSLLFKTTPVLNTRPLKGVEEFLDRLKEEIQTPIIATSSGETESAKSEI